MGNNTCSFRWLAQVKNHHKFLLVKTCEKSAKHWHCCYLIHCLRGNVLLVKMYSIKHCLPVWLLLSFVLFCLPFFLLSSSSFPLLPSSPTLSFSPSLPFFFSFFHSFISSSSLVSSGSLQILILSLCVSFFTFCCCIVNGFLQNSCGVVFKEQF